MVHCNGVRVRVRHTCPHIRVRVPPCRAVGRASLAKVGRVVGRSVRLCAWSSLSLSPTPVTSHLVIPFARRHRRPRHLASTAFMSMDMHVHILGGRGYVGGQHVSVTGQPGHPSKGSCMPTKLQVSS